MAFVALPSDSQVPPIPPEWSVVDLAGAYADVVRPDLSFERVLRAAMSFFF